MGNNQTTSNDGRQPENYTQAAFEQTLVKQRLLYEERWRQLLLQAQSSHQEDTTSTRRNGENRQNSLYPNLSHATAAPLAHSSSAVVNNYPSRDKMNNVLTATNAAPPLTNNANFKYLHEGTSRLPPSAPPAPSTSSRLPATATRPQPKKNNDGGKELKCPTCGKQFGLSIFQCGSGHSSCRECKVTGGVCRFMNCGKIITDMRNRTLEAYIADIMLAQQASAPPSATNKSQSKINCPNQHDGCSLRFSAHEMDNHLKECLFNEMACPLAAIFGRCSWRGKINHVASHFADVHPEHLQANVDTEITIQYIRSDKRMVHLVGIGTFNFLLHVKVDNAAQMIFMAAQFLGTKVSASKWNYEFHIYNKVQPRRKYQYEDVCLSNSICIEDIFRKSRCVIIPFAYAMTFENNDSFTFKFFLKKHQVLKNTGRIQQARGRGPNR